MVIRTLLTLSMLAIMAGCDRNPQSVDFTDFQFRNRTLYVINGLSETLSAIDIEEGIVYNDILELGKWPNDLAPGEDGGDLYVVNSGDNNIMEIDLNSGETRRTVDIGVGRNPWECAVSGTELWVTTFLTGELAVIDIPGGDLSGLTPLGATLQALLISQDALYVSDTNYQYGSFGPGRVIRVDRLSRTTTATGWVGINPQALLQDGLGRLHVLCTGDYSSDENGVTGEIHLVDSTDLNPLDTLALGGSPSAMCAGSDGTIFVSGYWGGVLSYREGDLEVLHDSSSPLLGGDGYTDIVYDERSGTLYVADFDEDRVIAVDPLTGRMVATYAVGDGPLKISFVEPN